MMRWRQYFALVMACGLCLGSFTASATDAPGATGFLPPLESFSEVLDRPLFAPDRKRHVKAAPLTPAGKPVLTAIVLLKDKRYATLREGAAARRVNEGDKVGDMTVKKILRDRIVMVSADGAEAPMQLFPEQPTETPPPAPQPVAQPVPEVAAGMSEGPPPGMTPANARTQKPLITSHPD